MSIPMTRMLLSSFGLEACGQHGNYGFALAAHPGEPQVPLNNGLGSQPMVQKRLPALMCFQRPLTRMVSHSADPKISRVPKRRRLMPDNAQVERMNRTNKGRP